MTILAALVTIGCSSATAASESKPTVVVSTSIWADIVENLLCEQAHDEVAVTVLFDTNADPHTAELQLSDRARLADASLVVINGAGLESTLSDTIDAVEADGVPVLNLASTISDRVIDNDPHFWLDPSIVAETIVPLSDRLIELGADNATVTSCAEEYRRSLEAVDTKSTKQFANLAPSQRRLAVVHGFGYFASRYDLEIVATVEPETDQASPSPAALAATIEVMNNEGITVLATDAYHHSDDVNAIKAAVDGLVEVPVYTSGLGPSDDTDTYIEVIEQNTLGLVAALAQ